MKRLLILAGTQNPLILRVPHFGDNVYLIDTPGFDDTHTSDADILKKIAECLQYMYQHTVKLRGIIYMHRIFDTRMTFSGMRNLKMFRQLCGPEPMRNIYLVTSFWDKVELHEGCLKEKELQTTSDMWGEMIQEGAKTARFKNTQASAHALIEILSKKPRIALQIQREMCDDNLLLAQTKAGQQVNEELAQLEKKHAEEMQELQKEMQEALQAADKKLEKVLAREQAKSEKRLEKIKAQQEALQADYRNQSRMLDQELELRLRRLQVVSGTQKVRS